MGDNSKYFKLFSHTNIHKRNFIVFLYFLSYKCVGSLSWYTLYIYYTFCYLISMRRHSWTNMTWIKDEFGSAPILLRDDCWQVTYWVHRQRQRQSGWGSQGCPESWREVSGRGETLVRRKAWDPRHRSMPQGSVLSHQCRIPELCNNQLQVMKLMSPQSF